MSIIQSILIASLLLHPQPKHEVYKFSDGNISFSCPVRMKAINKEYHIHTNHPEKSIPSYTAMDFVWNDNKITLAYCIYDRVYISNQEKEMNHVKDITINTARNTFMHWKKLYGSLNKSSFKCSNIKIHGVSMSLLFFNDYFPGKQNRILIFNDLFFSHNMIEGEFSILKKVSNSKECNLISHQYKKIILHIAHTLIVH